MCEKAKQVYACGRGECKMREKVKNYDVLLFLSASSGARIFLSLKVCYFQAYLNRRRVPIGLRDMKDVKSYPPETYPKPLYFKVPAVQPPPQQNDYFGGSVSSPWG